MADRGFGQLEIFFDDLDDKTQLKVLELYQIVSAKEMNWDTQPLFILEEPDFDN